MLVGVTPYQENSYTNIPQQQKEQLAYNLKLSGAQYIKRAEELLSEIAEEEKEI